MKFVRAHINFEKSSRSISLLVPENTPRYIAWAKRAIRFGLFLFLMQAGIHYAHEYLLDSALEQRRLLQKDVTKLQNRLQTFNGQIDRTFAEEELIHRKFGLTPPDQDIREMGVGGPVDPESALVQAATPAKAMSAQLLEQVGQFGSKIDRSQSTYHALKTYIEKQYLDWSRMPSIAPASGRFTSPFGIRVHPVTGEVGKMHYGIDVSNQRWTPIYASANGVIELVKNSEYFGNYVVINHGNGLQTKYGHMEKYVVKQGQLVERYQVIGYMGRTGRTTGVHLHYEVWVNDNAVNPIHYVLPNDYAVE